MACALTLYVGAQAWLRTARPDAVVAGPSLNVSRWAAGKMTPMTEPIDPFEQAIDGMDYPDGPALHDAQHAQVGAAGQLGLGLPVGSLGDLSDLSTWISAAQGQFPPADFHRVRLIVIAGDHGVAAAGVSAAPANQTRRLLRDRLAGGGAVQELARLVGVSARFVDLAVRGDTDPALSQFKIRESSGSIDREDALSEDEARRALAAGVQLAEDEVSAGADLLLLANTGVGASTAASALISILTDTEPVKVIGRGSGIDDAGWIAKCAAVRDARRRGWPERYDLPRLMAVAGGADLAAMAGFIAQAAYRRTPVLIDGLAAVAAALAVQRRDPRVARWLRAAQLSPEPAHLIGLQRLGLEPVLSLQMSAGEGIPALLAVPILRAAALAAASLAAEGWTGA